jgi:hypothetical protein
MQTMTDIYELAGEAYGQFETRARNDGENYVTLKDNAPEWLQDLVHDAHGDFLPDDWRYQSIRDAIGFIHDVEPGDLNDGHEFADQNVDTYTGSRFAWLASNLQRAGYCDEAAAEFGTDPEGGIVQLIGMGQYMESLEVWASVVEGLREQIDA